MRKLLGIVLALWCATVGRAEEQVTVEQWKANSRARTYALHISIAANQYFSDYGKFPHAGKQEKDAMIENAELMRVLCSIPNGLNKDNVWNPYKTNYFPADRGGFKDDAYLDPWGKPYLILVDYDGDSAVTLSREKIAKVVAVWSCGQNGIDDMGKGDDITSWNY